MRYVLSDPDGLLALARSETHKITNSENVNQKTEPQNMENN